MVGSGPPNQHDGFFPDFLGLDCLLVLTTGRSAVGGKYKDFIVQGGGLHKLC